MTQLERLAEAFAILARHYGDDYFSWNHDDLFLNGDKVDSAEIPGADADRLRELGWTLYSGRGGKQWEYSGGQS